MSTFLFSVTLFLTALTAGRICAAKGYRALGIAAFVLLESAYLTMFFGTWWVAAVLLLAGAAIVFRCQLQPVVGQAAEVASRRYP